MSDCSTQASSKRYKCLWLAAPFTCVVGRSGHDRPAEPNESATKPSQGILRFLKLATSGQPEVKQTMSNATSFTTPRPTTNIGVAIPSDNRSSFDSSGYQVGVYSIYELMHSYLPYLYYCSSRGWEGVWLVVWNLFWVTESFAVGNEECIYDYRHLQRHPVKIIDDLNYLTCSSKLRRRFSLIREIFDR